MSSIELTNLRTNTTIKDENLALDLGQGVLLKNKDCIKFVPEAYLKRETIADAGEYSNNEQVPELNSLKNTSGSYTEKAVYRFGLENIEFQKVQYDKVCAIISEPIEVKDADYITLEVVESPKFNSSAEYYVLDETMNETAILPVGESRIEMEKLFYGLPTRFLVDSEKESPILYEDTKPSNKNYLSLTFSDFSEHEYCLSYYPYTEKAYRHIPNSNSIRVKVIIRSFTDIFSPVSIKDIKVRIWKDTDTHEQN